MKWMIASDLHGSYYYAQQLQQAFEREQADRLLFLGDLLYHGPRNDLPREYALPNVISMLVNSLYNIVDSLFVARISEDAMTALSLVFPIQNFSNAIAIESSSGSTGFSFIKVSFIKNFTSYLKKQKCGGHSIGLQPVSGAKKATQ